jgi:hypothetical protein
LTVVKLRPAHLVLGATLLAAFLRFHRLTTLAPGAWFDEVWFALRARDLLADPQFIPFYRTPWGGGNALLVYLTAIVQWLGLAGLTSSRFASAALGVISTPLAYACFSEMLGESSGQSGNALQSGSGLQPRWIAALAALILSYLLYWVIVSRVGTEPSLAPAAALFCVWQLKRAKRISPQSSQRAQSFKKNISADSVFSVVKENFGFVLVGLVAGLAQYNGPHARFVLPLMGFVSIYDLLRTPAPRRRRYLFGLGLATLSGLVVVAPLALFFIREPEWLLARARVTTSVSFRDPGLLLTNLRFILISFSFVGSFDPLTNYPGLPMFDPVQSLGFFVGHGWALWNWRRSAAARELLVWEIVMALPSLLTSDAPNFQRMIGFGAPASALVAIGWWLAVDRLARLGVGGWKLEVRSWKLEVGILALGISLSLLFQSTTLFIRYPSLTVLPLTYLARAPETARELIRRAEAGERVFVSRIPETQDVISFEYLFPGTPVERLDLRQCRPLTHNRRTRTNYLVLNNHDKDSVVPLYDAYPDSKITYIPFEQEGAGTLIEVPPGRPGPRPPHPGQAAFEPGLTFLGYEWSGNSVQAGQSLFLTLWWKAETDLDTDYTSFVHVGTGLGGTGIVAQRDGQPCQGLFTTSHWRAGDLIRDSFAVTFPLDVPAGDYPLAIGWYTFPDLQRLPLLAADRTLPDNRAIIALITVTR